MHLCVGNLIIIGLDDGLLPGRIQAIIKINIGILLMGRLGTNFSEISIEILNSQIFIREHAFESDICEIAVILCRPQCVKHHTR